MTLGEVLQQAIAHLSPNESAQLDAEILLAHVLQRTRTYLVAHADTVLTSEQKTQYHDLIARRKKHEPVAYLTGHKEFWSLDLKVSPGTLIPRPETELLVELVLSQSFTNASYRIADLGTGSGAVALAIAHEKSTWEVVATDQSATALQVAKKNAATLGIKNIQFFQGHWCEALPSVLFDAIVSNPPYVSVAEWSDCSPELSFEPIDALIAAEDGLRDIQEIIVSALSYLHKGAPLWIEHGHTQAERIRILFEKSGYTQINSYLDLAGKERVTGGVRP